MRLEHRNIQSSFQTLDSLDEVSSILESPDFEAALHILVLGIIVGNHCRRIIVVLCAECCAERFRLKETCKENNASSNHPANDSASSSPLLLGDFQCQPVRHYFQHFFASVNENSQISITADSIAGDRSNHSLNFRRSIWILNFSSKPSSFHKVCDKFLCTLYRYA